MAVFIESLKQDGDDHLIEPIDLGFMVLRKPGRVRGFNDLARRVLEQQEIAACFPRLDGDGNYIALHVIPLD